jgi:hypothetical protein
VTKSYWRSGDENICEKMAEVNDRMYREVEKAKETDKLEKMYFYQQRIKTFFSQCDKRIICDL